MKSELDDAESRTPPSIARLPLPEFIMLVALLTSLVALSIDAMLPALDVIGAELNSDSAQQTYLIVSIFFIGMAFGQVFFGTFADARGRRLTILVGLLIFLVGTAVCYFATNMYWLLAGRLIQAFGASGPRIASMALVRDLYVGDAMARVMSFVTVVFILVPMLAPLTGQLVMQNFGWRHIFTMFILVTVVAGLWFFSRQQETLPRSKRVKFRAKPFIKSILWLVRQPGVMGPTLGMGFLFGAFLAYLSASQSIFQGIYDTGSNFPYLFAMLAFAIGVAAFFNGMMVMKLGMLRLINISLAMNVLFSLVLFSVTLFYDGVPPLVTFMSIMFLGFLFIGVLFGNLNSLAMIPVGHIAGVGAAFIGSLSSFLAVPFAIFINSFFEDNLIPIAIGFLVFSILTYVSVRIGVRYTPKMEAS